MDRSRNGRNTQSRQPGQTPQRPAKRRAIVVAAAPEPDLAELQELLRTSGVAVVGELTQNREHPHPNLYLGPGKVEELKAMVKRLDATVVACDDELTPRQQRNLEKEL